MINTLSDVKIAHIGCGYWGENVLRNFAELGVLEAVIDSNSSIAQKYADEYGIKVMSFQDALNSSSIQAISIATPSVYHAEQVEKALKHKKHVIVEKPLALKLEDGEKLAGLAKKTKKILMIGHLLQYHPVYNYLKHMVKSGELGELRYIYSNRLSLGKVRREENVLWSFAPHDVSMILGLVDEYPVNITAQSSSILGKENYDSATIQFAFNNQLKGHIQLSWLHPFKEQRLIVIGERATAVFEDSQLVWENKLRIFNHKLMPNDPLGFFKGNVKNISVPEQEPLKAQCQHFIDCISQDLDVRTNTEEALPVLRFLCQASKYISG